jgi:hypothetical protein
MLKEVGDVVESVLALLDQLISNKRQLFKFSCLFGFVKKVGPSRSLCFTPAQVELSQILGFGQELGNLVE